MANDIDVKIGITTQGDASGAQAVDKALDEVKQSAQEAASAAGDAAAQAADKAAQAADKATTEVKELAAEMAKDPGTGGLSDAIGDLDAKTTSLSDDKKKAGVAGLSRALEGLARGDIATGVGGAADALFQMAQAIPIPGAAIGLSLAGIAISGVLEAIRSDASETAETFRNEFGETLDEEMARLEAWASANIEWDNIQRANANLRDDFDLVKSTAESAQAAIESLFSARIASQMAGLRGEAAKADAAGDTAGAADLRAQAEQLKQYEELVKLNSTLIAAQSELEALKAQADAQAENFRATEEATKQSAELLEALKQQIVDRTGNIDATVPGSQESIALLQQIEGRLERAERLNERTVQYLERTGSPDAAGFRALFDDIPAMRQLLDDLRNLDQITNDAADKEAKLSKQLETSNASAVQMAQDLAAAAIQIEVLQTQLKDLAAAAGPDQAARAAEQAALITGQAADAMEAMLDLTVDNAGKIKSVAVAAAQGATAVSGDLESARKFYEEGAKKIGEGIGQIQEAVEGVAKEAVEGGDQVKAGAEEFRSKVREAVDSFSSAATDLRSTAGNMARVAAEIADEQQALAQEIASVRAQASFALASADLALSQNQNMG